MAYAAPSKHARNLVVAMPISPIHALMEVVMSFPVLLFPSPSSYRICPSIMQSIVMTRAKPEEFASRFPERWSRFLVTKQSLLGGVAHACMVPWRLRSRSAQLFRAPVESSYLRPDHRDATPCLLSQPTVTRRAIQLPNSWFVCVSSHLFWCQSFEHNRGYHLGSYVYSSMVYTCCLPVCRPPAIRLRIDLRSPTLPRSGRP